MKEKMKLIADSGSTKTAWSIVGASPDIVYTQGINPFQQSEEDICAVLRHELVPALGGKEDELKEIHFYGAGCTPEKAPLVAQALRMTVCPTAKISVESDMLGAARGLCGRQPGIVAILGTGSNSGFYDGRTLHPGIPALGFILGDEGSGAYIGKRLVGDILKRQLPEDVCRLFFDETHETPASIIQKVYRIPLPNRYLASLSPFCSRHRQHPAIQSFIISCFEQFFHRNILPILSSQPLPCSVACKENPTVHFVGSIAHYYCDELAEAAKRCHCQVGNIMQSPLDGLIQYHQEQTPRHT